jgi:hypothetical protein
MHVVTAAVFIENIYEESSKLEELLPGGISKNWPSKIKFLATAFNSILLVLLTHLLCNRILFRSDLLLYPRGLCEVPSIVNDSNVSSWNWAPSSASLPFQDSADGDSRLSFDPEEEEEADRTQVKPARRKR